jgi:hypothetical protein
MAVANRKTGKYLEPIKLYDDYGTVASILRKAGGSEYSSTTPIDSLERISQSTYKMVYKLSSDTGICVCCPGVTTYLLRFSNYKRELLSVTKLIHCKVQPVSGISTMKEWLDEINDVLKNEYALK